MSELQKNRTLSSDLGSKISSLRREHSNVPLSAEDLDSNPFEQFRHWLQEAIDAEIQLPNAMTVATADPDGRPSARVTLLKDVDDCGFVFFTNYESRKGQELEANPFAALVFYWGPLGRQIRVEGRVEKVSQEESDAYYQTRSRGSRIGAWASPQSRVISGRDVLDQRVRELEGEYPDGDLPLPPHWGGFRLLPDRFEFWKGRESRLHDRLQYRLREDGGWTIERLAP